MKKTIETDEGEIAVSDLDITGEIGGLHSDCKWTMYSYERPAFVFWNGVAKGLAEKGATIEEIQWWLQSKNARWLLDGMSDEIEKMGEKYGKDEDIKDIRRMMNERQR